MFIRNHKFEGFVSIYKLSKEERYKVGDTEEVFVHGFFTSLNGKLDDIYCYGETETGAEVELHSEKLMNFLRDSIESSDDMINWNNDKHVFSEEY